MRRILLALAAASVLSSPAFAAKIGVSMDKFDDNFLTVLRNGMADYAKTVASQFRSRTPKTTSPNN
jgi:inositol transport system substrate-binding protein